MKQTRLFKFCALLILAAFLMVGPAFAATYYVDATNGNDNVNDGSSASNSAAGVGPFLTIGKAVTTAADGDVIMIAAANAPGYVEAVGITKSVTLVGYQLDTNTEVKITGNLTINGAGKTVSLGESGTASFYLVGNVALTAGALNIDGSNVTLQSNGTITRTAGTLDESFTISSPGNLNVTYDGAADITAGPELVTSLSAGSLTNAITAAKTLTIETGHRVNTFVQNNAGSTTVNGDFTTLNTVTVSNAGTLKITGDLDAGGNVTTANTSKIDVDGTITLGTDDVINHNSTGTFDAGTVVGKVSIAGGNLVVIDNQSTGDLTIGTVTLTPVSNDDATAGDNVVATIQNTSTGDLVISGVISGNGATHHGTTNPTKDDILYVYLDADGAAGGTVTLGSANSIDNLKNNGTLTINGDLTLTGKVSAAHNNNSSTINGTGILVFAAAPAGGTHTLADAGAVVDITANATLNIDDAAAASITITGNVIANANITIDGVANATTDKITGTLTVASGKTVTNSTAAIEVTGNATVAGTFQSQAAATFKADMALTGTLNADATTTIEGSLSQTGAGAVDADAALTIKGNWTNASTAASDVSVGALDVDGTFTISGTGTTTLQTNAAFGGFNQSAGALETANAITFTMEGDFTRTNGSFDVNSSNFDGNGADGGDVTINFTGSNNATITAGPQLYLYDLNINKTGSAVVTVTQSLVIVNDLAVVSTAAVDFGTKTFTVRNDADWDGSMTSTGGGGLLFDTNGSQLSGDGTLSNITVAMTNTTDNVIIPNGEEIVFTGIVACLKGYINVNYTAAATDISPSGASAAVTINPQQSSGIVLTSLGTFNADGVDYDLTYTGTLTADAYVAANSSEFDPTHVRNLTISTKPTTATVEQLIITSAGNLTIKNNFVASEDAEVELRTAVVADALNAANFAATTFTVSDGTKFHKNDWITIAGSTSNDGTYLVTNVVGNVITCGNATFNVEAGAGNASVPVFSLTVQGAMTLNDDVVLSGGDATKTITLDKDDATHVVKGKITAASVLTVDATGVTISGTGADLAADQAELGSLAILTDGSLTIVDIQAINGTVTAGATTNVTLGLTQDSTTPADTDNSIVAGLITAGGTTFTLGSNIEAAAGVTITNGTLALNGYKLNLITGGAFAGSANVVYAAGGEIEVNVAMNFGINGETLNCTFDVNAVTTLTSDVVLGSSAAFYIDANMDLNGNDLTIPHGQINANFIDGGAGTGKLIAVGSSTAYTIYNDISVVNMEVNSDATVTFATSDVTAPITYRTITVPGVLTQTKGTIALGGNDISLTGTAGDVFDRTAGAWTATTGELILAGNAAAITIDPGDGWSVPNLTINNPDATPGAFNFDDDKDFTVTNALVLKDGNLDADQDNDGLGKLHLASGCTVTRDASASTLVRVPTFDGTVNVVYNDPTAAAGNGTTGNEMPGDNTTLNDLTINAITGAAGIILNKDIVVNGKLTLADLLDATTTANVEVTMADGSTLELQADGTTVLDENLTKVGAMDLIYNGAANTSTRELGLATTAATHTATNVTVKSNVKLDNSATFTGALNLNGGDLDLNAKSLYVTSDFSQTNATDFFTNTGASNGTLILSGATSTALTLKGNQTIEDDIDIEVAKDNDNNVVTLSGGNLDFQAGETKAAAPAPDVFGMLKLTKGILNTGDKMVVLAQGENALNQPMQGFERTDGVVVGKIKKLVQKQYGVERANMQFPVGTPSAQYRVATFFFNDEPQSSFYLTVGHSDDSPGGTNGIPFTTDTDNITVTSYPDFAWSVTSDVTIAPSYEFDMELQAEDYEFYQTDNIENVRMIRRANGSIDNEWRLQGSDANYDNQTVSTAWPLVKVIDATGGLTTQGSIFTFSQSSQAPRWSIAPATGTVNEAATLTLAYRAVDEDINQWPTIEVVGDLPSFATLNTFATASGATADSANLVLAPTYADSGDYTIVLRATDGEETADTTITIRVNNVNQPATFVTVPADTTIDEGSVYTFTYAIEDLDGDTPQYTVVDSVGADIAITAAGVLTFTAPAGSVTGLVDTVVVSVTDNVAPVTTKNDTLIVTIMKPVAPVFATVMPDSDVRTGDTLTFTYAATDANTPAGDVVKYALVEEVTGASIVEATGVFSFAAADDMAKQTFTVVVSATDASGNVVKDTAEVTVKSNILGDVDLSGRLQSYDASLTLQHVVKKITLTGDSLALADVSGAGGVSAYDASWIFIKVLNPDTALFDAYGPLAKTLVAAGDADWSVTSDVVNENFVNVPVTIANAKDVYSFEFTAEVDPSIVKVEEVSMSLPQGWQIAQNIDNGVVRVAAFGTTPVDASTIGNIKLEVLNKLAVSEINGSIVLNENNSRDMKSLAVRQIPSEFKLSQNYPNPFNPTTNIAYQIADNAKVVVNIYDMLGNKIQTLVNENKAAGYYTVQWNGLNENGARMASGTYFYHIQAGNYNSTKKMLLIK